MFVFYKIAVTREEKLEAAKLWEEARIEAARIRDCSDRESERRFVKQLQQEEEEKKHSQKETC